MTAYFHTTPAADAILRHGFRNGTGSYGFAAGELTGVWLGAGPCDINDGAKGDQCLRVEFPDEVDLDEFAVDEGEWCVPAALINECATVTLLTDEELWEMGSPVYRGYLDGP